MFTVLPKNTMAFVKLPKICNTYENYAEPLYI